MHGSHSHDHGTSHGAALANNERRMGLAASLTGAFMFAEVAGGIMVVIAALGLIVNVAAFALLRGADRDNLNIRGAAIHVLGDLLGSIAALIAGGVILFTGWTPIDPLLSLVVAVIIVKSGWQVVADAGHILLEGAPEELDTRAIPPDLVVREPFRWPWPPEPDPRIYELLRQIYDVLKR